MTKLVLGTFAVAGVIAVGGLDYSAQTQKANLKLGQLGVGAYLDTIAGRYGAVQADRASANELAELRLREPRTFLPVAVTDWAVRDWNEEDHVRLLSEKDAALFETHLARAEEDQGFNILKVIAGPDRHSADRRAIRFYTKGSSIVQMRLSVREDYRAADPLGAQGAAMSIVEGNMRAMITNEPFALVEGMAFARQYGWGEFGEVDPDDETVVHTIVGVMGNEVMIAVRAKATGAEILEVLSQIDIDMVNKLLTNPLPNVGSSAPEVDPEEALLIAASMIDADTAAAKARGKAAEEGLIALGKALPSVANANETGDPTVESMIPVDAADVEASGGQVLPQVRRAGIAGDETCDTSGAGKRCAIGSE